MSHYEVLIIGGGPAGLQAALTLGRMRRTVLLVDDNRPRNAAVSLMHNFISRDGFPPGELRRLAREELARYQTVEVTTGSALAVSGINGNFTLSLADGRIMEGRRIILATGLADELPEIPGLTEAWGKSAFICPYCDGFEHRDGEMAVLGAGRDRAVSAVHLRQLSDRVTMLSNGPDGLDEDTRQILSTAGVTIQSKMIERVIHGESPEVQFVDGSRFHYAAMFVPSRLKQRSPLAEMLGCMFLQDGCVRVDALGHASVPGISAIGDMAHVEAVPGPLAAVVAAAASGVVAGAVTDRELLMEAMSQRVR